MYASVHLEKFAHKVDPFLRLTGNSSSFHNEIISMTMSGYLISDITFTGGCL